MIGPRACGSVLAVVLLVAACGGGAEEPIGSGDPGFVHVHALALDGDGGLLVASHMGLFSVADGEAELIGGDARHDLMALAIERDGTLLASGHPDLRSPTLRVEDRPPLLGLVESSDGGATWTARSLLGEADFHALVVTADAIVGVDGTSQTLLVSEDGIVWEGRGELDALSLAIDPGDARRMLAVDYDGLVHSSTDGGSTWIVLDAPPAAAVQWPSPGRVVVASTDGALYRADDLAGPWVEVGRPGGSPEALLATVDTMWVATDRGDVQASSDGGRTWSTIYDGRP